MTRLPAYAGIFGGPDQDDEMTRTELVGGQDKEFENGGALLAEKKRDRAATAVCAKEIKPELNTVDEADFVRDVEKSASHYLSQNEIDGDKPGSRQLSA